jgi:hypothetical protein
MLHLPGDSDLEALHLTSQLWERERVPIIFHYLVISKIKSSLNQTN